MRASTVFRREPQDSAFHDTVLFLFFHVSCARRSRFCSVCKRHGVRWYSTKLGAIKIRREGEQPRRKRRVLPPLAESTPRAQESLLRHVLGARAIMAKAVCQVDQRALPAANDILKSAEFTCENSFHDALVVARAQPAPPLVRPGKITAGCIFSRHIFLREIPENATEPRFPWSYGMKRHEPQTGE